MIDSPSIGFLIKAGIFLTVNARRFLDLHLPSSPQHIRRKTYDKMKTRKLEPLMKELEKMREEDLDQASLGDRETLICRRFEEIGNRFWYRGQVLWGRATSREALKSAWYYVLAGEAFEYAKSVDRAARMFHWAAHQFRQLDSLGRARHYYIKAADIFRRVQQYEDAARSARRAVGVCEMIGDEETIKKLRKNFDHLLDSRPSDEG